MVRARIGVSDWVGLTLLLLFCFILLFWQQAILPMQAWDESRLANNALEMVRSGNWLVPQYNGSPDHYNTKPPLLIWAIASLMRLGAPPLLALRAPSFVAVAATIAIAWGFCLVILGDRLAGAISGMLLITSGLYAGPHVARTGDYDALLTFFILLYSLAFWLAIEGVSLRPRWMALSAFAVLLAILTKGIAGLVPLPGLLAFAMLRGRLIVIAHSWQVWVLAATVISMGLGYYLSREVYDPGYLLAVWNNEVGGRYFGQSNSYPSYYVRTMLSRDPVIIGALLLTSLPLFGSDCRARNFVIFCLFFSTILLLILQLAYNKHYWYVAPAYPPLAMAAALGISSATRHLGFMLFQRNPRIADFPLPSALTVFLIASCIVGYFVGKPLATQVARVNGYPHYEFGRFFEDLQNATANEQVLLIVRPVDGVAPFIDYNPMAKFYTEFFSQHEPKIIVVPLTQPLPTGSQVATCDHELQQLLKVRPNFHPLWQKDGCLFGIID